MDEKRKHLVWTVKEYSDLLGQCPDGPAIKKTDTTALDPQALPYEKLTAVQTIKAILAANGAPMRVVELAQAASAGGYGGANADPKKVVPNFSSTLSRVMKEESSPFRKGKVKYTFALSEWKD